MLWLTVLAEQTDPDLWLTLGPLAVVPVLLGAVAWLRTELTGVRRRLERVEDQRLELAERALPSLQSSTEALERSAALNVDQSSQLRLTADLLDELRRDLRHGRSDR